MKKGETKVEVVKGIVGGTSSPYNLSAELPYEEPYQIQLDPDGHVSLKWAVGYFESLYGGSQGKLALSMLDPKGPYIRHITDAKCGVPNCQAATTAVKAGKFTAYDLSEALINAGN